MKFTKMHGIGNDYVYVNCFEEKVEDPARVAQLVSDRHFGIGSDGLILIKPSDVADCEMDMYNLDGSRGAMCGNGIRCVAKYVFDHGIVNRKSIRVATGSGIRDLELSVTDGKVSQVRVNMGAPILEAPRIPVLKQHLGESRPSPAAASVFSQLALGGHETDPAQVVIDAPLETAGSTWSVTAVSMGNPHLITFVQDTQSLDLERIGPDFEHHPAFPDRINTEFIQVEDAHTLRMRVWERGSGETLACGTGACASAVAAILTGRVSADGPVLVKLLGGDLHIEWNRQVNTVYMTGPATEVFHGEIDL
ncbi:MAG: diaminopimelate epimerase [Blautia sp.]|nr:diaminopimelate epimerase [Blautia sp.]